MSWTMRFAVRTAVVMLGVLVCSGDPAGAQEKSADYISGSPDKPTRSWSMASGGRLYDNWMEALGKTAPDKTHPLWPASNTEKSGKDTWRCKSCHGWDYLGAKGQNAAGDYKTGIKGVTGVVGRSPKAIIAMFSDPRHGYTDEMIPPAERQRLAVFLAYGQHRTALHIDGNGKARGNAAQGAAIYQNVCAACHGYDGRTLSWGDAKNPAFVGTEANGNPWEVLHKIRNGHPGHNMVALRDLPMRDAVNALAYAQTLPQK